MNIILPRRLTYKEQRELMSRYYELSTQGDEMSYRFDWSATEWVNLPDVVTILNWSSKLTQLGKSVEWLLQDPRQQSEEVQRIRPLANQILGNNLYDELRKRLDKLKQKVNRRALNAFDLHKEIRGIENKTRLGNPSPVIKNWLDLEKSPFNYIELLTYFDRYDVFNRATSVGISISPEPHTLPRVDIKKSPDTACLELRPIQSITEVQGVVDKLNDPHELSRVLGAYAGLDFVRGGALASILITELGNNVWEHSKATAAWLCTRLVTASNLSLQAQNDSALSSFREQNAGFLEVIVCDNGQGLTAKLEGELQKDQRASVRNKFNRKNLPKALSLVDYAFDRLSSSRRRDLAQLLHLQNQEDLASSVVSSGLYWVWNVVRSHQGILSVRTANIHAWYDFTDWGNQETDQRWELKYPNYDASLAPSCGTMIRICLPLSENQVEKDFEAARKYPRKKYNSRLYKKPTAGTSLEIVWVGDLAQSVPLKPLGGDFGNKNLPSSRALPGIYEDHETRLLQELEKRHFPLKDGDVLVLDLCGVRYKWAKESVVPLCHFVLEMNYTSSVGRSTVVLWNVPSSSKEVFEMGIKLGGLFEKSIEDANERHSHLKDFRRAVLLIFDDESIRIFCGWPEAERILGRLSLEGELDFDELKTSDLSPEDQNRLLKLISENSHLFEILGGRRVRLRAWPPAIRVEAWKQGMQWYNALLDKEVGKGGVHLTPEHEYFRLPSTGLLVKDFYQFRGLLANHQTCSKLAWHIAQVIMAISTASEPLAKIISISRSTMPLAHRLFEDYSRIDNSPLSEVLAENTIEELEVIGGNRTIDGYAVLITDVISSGSMCRRIAMAFPNIKWVATIALLDTRDDAYDPVQGVELSKLKNGIELFKTKETDTGTVYSLAIKNVPKTDPKTIGPTTITAIDEVNVCAVKNFDKLPDAREEFWEYIVHKPDALNVGHYTGNSHHYIYKVEVGLLLDAAPPQKKGRTLLEFIIDCVVQDLDKGYNPDKTIIIHPPHDHSYAERIAKAVQTTTGILYRHVLYKDNFAGHWRFSPFVQHGVPLDQNTLVLIDDGTNTAETLMGLLDAATFGQSKNIYAYVGITRMPPHKNHLFTSLNTLKGVKGSVKVEFTLGLSIPVFSPRECPVCRFTQNMSLVERNSPLLETYARRLNEAAAPIQQAEDKERFLWKYASETSVTKLRESIETLDYHVEASLYVDAHLKLATNAQTDKDAYNNLLDLAFVICAEPDLAGTTVFVPYLDDGGPNILTAAIARIKDCPEEHLMTIAGLVFHLIVKLSQRSSSMNFEREALSLWLNLFKREKVTTQTVGKVIACIFSEAISKINQKGASQEVEVCEIWLKQLRNLLNSKRHTRGGIGGTVLTRSFSYLFIREALSAIRKVKPPRFTSLPNKSTDLYDIATEAASKFWWHASDHVKRPIGALNEAVRKKKATVHSAAYGPIHSLIIAFDDLYDLQERLSEIESSCLREINETPGAAVYWDAPELNHAIATFMQALAGIVEEVEEKRESLDRKIAQEAANTLSKTWDQLTGLLNPSFEEIFPEIQNVVALEWGNFVATTSLPQRVAQPLEIATELRDSHDRVFIPRTLLLRFLSVAMQNLETSAFNGWTKEEVIADGKAHIEVFPTQDEKENTLICVRIVDNGPMHEQKAKPGQGRGLKEVGVMAEKFGAQLIFPEKQEMYTSVELRMRHRGRGTKKIPND